MKKGIEFADETWNPVWGCHNNCPYCFARPIAKRFASPIAIKEVDYLGLNPGSDSSIDIYDDLRAFKPMLMQSQLQKKFKKKTTHVFVNSMSDIMYWEKAWLDLVLTQMSKYPDKIFVFFTKDITAKYYVVHYLLNHCPENGILIFTANSLGENDSAVIAETVIRHANRNCGICFEPLQSDTYGFNATFYNYWYKWVIIGAETGNRKNKIEVKSEWLEPFYDLKIPVFMKESIRHLVPAEKFRQERI